MKKSKKAQLPDGFPKNDLDAYFRSRKPPEPLRDPKIGDKVAYTRYFLKQIGVSATDDMWRARGTITGFESVGKEVRWAQIQWADEPTPRLVALSNLCRPGPNLAHCE